MDNRTGLGRDLQERVDSNVGASPGYSVGFYTAIIKVRTMLAEMENFDILDFLGESRLVLEGNSVHMPGA